MKKILSLLLSLTMLTSAVTLPSCGGNDSSSEAPTEAPTEPEPEIIPVIVNNHNTVREFEVFADHILNDTPVEMDARLGAKTIAACLAIVESANTGKPVVPNYEF